MIIDDRPTRWGPSYPDIIPDRYMVTLLGYCLVTRHLVEITYTD